MPQERGSNAGRADHVRKAQYTSERNGPVAAVSWRRGEAAPPTRQATPKPAPSAIDQALAEPACRPGSADLLPLDAIRRESLSGKTRVIQGRPPDMAAYLWRHGQHNEKTALPSGEPSAFFGSRVNSR